MISCGVACLLEEEESWESFNAETLSDFVVDGCINLGEVLRRVVLGEGLSCLGVLRCKTLAVTTIPI